MSRPVRFLCLFSSEDLRAASFFARLDGHWISDIEQGRCEFVPLVLDAESSALAASGLFAAATFLVHPSDLDLERTSMLSQGAAAFDRMGTPFEVVAADAPVELLARLAGAAPELIHRCRHDGEIDFDSPSWWRQRARIHLAGLTAVAASEEGDEPDTQALRAFLAQRCR